MPCPSRLSSCLASFLVGVAAYYAWAVPIGRGADGFYLAVWFAMGFVASLGAARVVLLFAHEIHDTPPSLDICTLAYVGGGAVAVSMPESWLDVLDFAGSACLMLLALGWLVGMGDLVMRLATRLADPKRRAPKDLP